MTACDKPGMTAEAKHLNAVLRGDAKGSAASNPMCKLFTVAEASACLGKKLGACTNAAMGTGCQWADADSGAKVLIQAVPLRYAGIPPRSAPN